MRTSLISRVPPLNQESVPTVATDTLLPSFPNLLEYIYRGAPSISPHALPLQGRASHPVSPIVKPPESLDAPPTPMDEDQHTHSSSRPGYTGTILEWNMFLKEEPSSHSERLAEVKKEPFTGVPPPPLLHPSQLSSISLVAPVLHPHIVPTPDTTSGFQKPAEILYHQSLAKPPLINMDLANVTGPIPYESEILEEMRVHNYSKYIIGIRARELLDYYQSYLYLPAQVNRALLLMYRGDESMEKIVLPALMARGIVFRAPLPWDSEQLTPDVLHAPLPPSDLLQQLAANFGELEDGEVKHRMLMITSLLAPQEPIGLLYLKMHATERGRVCRIGLLEVLSQKRNRGFGTLLLSYALQIARKEQCSEMIFKASSANLEFCLRMGFENRGITTRSNNTLFLALDDLEKVKSLKAMRDFALNPYYKR